LATTIAGVLANCLPPVFLVGLVAKTLNFSLIDEHKKPRRAIVKTPGALCS